MIEIDIQKAIVSPKRNEVTSVPLSKDGGYSESSELAQAKPAGDVLDRPDEPAEAIENSVDKSLPPSADQSFSFESGSIDRQATP